MNDLSKFYEHITQYCDVAVKDAYLLTPEEFTESRRIGLGASDASVYLNLQREWKTTEDLIVEKIQTGLSENEMLISKKPNVRKGRDLEQLILQKASALLNTTIIKPTDTFRMKDYNFIIINFDGVAYNEQWVPVEAKLCSNFGEKHYNTKAAILTEFTDIKRATWKYEFGTLEESAAMAGIPPYYYAQLQQQMNALKSDYGYLAVLHDKDWTLRIYYVPKDNNTQTRIITEGHRVWQRVERLRKIKQEEGI